mmetsp:Transcript_89551/g.178992  ORF Transcript_89551/g.178992 Transcript_89551/m.178992 type:complete len:86 (-) Transcript_89551:75-332(-)
MRLTSPPMRLTTPITFSPDAARASTPGAQKNTNKNTTAKQKQEKKQKKRTHGSKRKKHRQAISKSARKVLAKATSVGLDRDHRSL